MFHYVVNLTELELHVGLLPWEFQATEKITPQIRKVKEDRQAWYQNPETKHYFYSLIEPINNRQRLSKTNPAYKLWGFAADYDLPISDERIKETIEAMPLKPSWVETSLGGNRRLVWLLPQPIIVDGNDHAVFILKQAKAWLKLDLLPGLDENAFETVTRMLCHGGVWVKTGHGPIELREAQSFFVECGRKFRFKAPTEEGIPMDVVWKGIKEKYPDLVWNGDFVDGAQGATFWIPESTSPMSAIVKTGGMYTFSAHADQPFYSWAHPALLGKEFCSQFVKGAMAEATNEIYYDGKNFHRKIKGKFEACNKEDIQLFLEVSCRVSGKPDASGVSPMKVALAHIMNENRIKGAGPFAFRPQGIINFKGENVLNTYRGKPIQPAEGKQEWGEKGNFPLISKILDNLFADPCVYQLKWLMAWFKYYYGNVLRGTPQPGQSIFMLGGVGVGKTLLNRYVFGDAVGGFADPVGFLVDGESFNAHLFEWGHWSLDDDTPAATAQDIYRLSSRLKKMVANDCFTINEKFMKQVQTEWRGRIICTANSDMASSRIMGPMDNNVRDKICLLLCVPKGKFEFPSREETIAAIQRELPYFLRWVLDHDDSDVPKDPRFGVASYHHPLLLEQAHQSNPIAPMKEVLVETLTSYFTSNPESQTWKGTMTQLMKLICMDPLNDRITHSTKPEQVNRMLEQIQKEGIIRCDASTDPVTSMRVWTFHRQLTIQSGKAQEVHDSVRTTTSGEANPAAGSLAGKANPETQK